MDDRRVGLVMRALRRRRGWRQVDLGRAADVSQSVISRAERGHLGSLSWHTLRRILTALDARLEADVRWRGGELDRLLDSRHALLVATASEVMLAAGWSVHQELTYSIYGERGALDLVGARQDAGTAVATEIKSEITSWEETQRRFDAKVRLMPDILGERLGWRPRIVGQVIVLDDSSTNRRRIRLLGRAVDHAYPSGSREVRRWLRNPDGPLRGLWFLSPGHGRNVREKTGGFHRVRRPVQPPGTLAPSAPRATARPAPDPRPAATHLPLPG